MRWILVLKYLPLTCGLISTPQGFGLVELQETLSDTERYTTSAMTIKALAITPRAAEGAPYCVGQPLAQHCGPDLHKLSLVSVMAAMMVVVAVALPATAKTSQGDRRRFRRCSPRCTTGFLCALLLLVCLPLTRAQDEIEPVSATRELVALRVFKRVQWAHVAFILPVSIGACSKSTFHLHSAPVVIPHIAFALIAALAPKDLPRASSEAVATLLAVHSAADANRALSWWDDTDFPWEVRAIRSGISWAWACGLLFLGLHVWHHSGQRFWWGLRNAFLPCCAIRLVGLVMLRLLSAPPNCYPPAKLDFPTALVVNLVGSAICFAVSASSRLRHLVSSRGGGTLEVLTLADMPSEADVAAVAMGLAEACKNGYGMNAGEACFADARENRSSSVFSVRSSASFSASSSDSSSDSFDTESAASTTRIDDEEFCNGPLNAEEFSGPYWTSLRGTPA